jgi:hypothetical protein
MTEFRNAGHQSTATPEYKGWQIVFCRLIWRETHPDFSVAQPTRELRHAAKIEAVRIVGGVSRVDVPGSIGRDPVDAPASFVGAF